jgi:hypothetical protein
VGIVVAIQSTEEKEMADKDKGKPGCDYCGESGASPVPYKDGNMNVYAHPACRALAREESK